MHSREPASQPTTCCRPPPEHADKLYHWLRSDDVFKPAMWSCELWMDIGYSGAQTPEGIAEDGWTYHAPIPMPEPPGAREDRLRPAEQAAYAVLAEASCTPPECYDDGEVIPHRVRVDGEVDVRKLVEAIRDAG